MSRGSRRYTRPSFSPLFTYLSLSLSEKEEEEEEECILVPVGMGAFRISDIKADTASIPLKYHASVASTRDFSSPRWRNGSSTEITSKRVNSLAAVATSIRAGRGEFAVEMFPRFMSRVGWFRRGVEILLCE